MGFLFDQEDTKEERETVREWLKGIVKEVIEEDRTAMDESKRPTKADIMAIQDRTERQKAIAENIDLFKGA